MPNRPAIPARIQREVFFEAGHRCAVCGTPFPLERAHIVPWHRTRKHLAADLICLCANCHERADHDWDEATLREYKANPWVNRQNGRMPEPEETSLLDLTIARIPLRRFSHVEQQRLVLSLAAFLEVHPEQIRVRKVRSGSVVVTLEMSKTAAATLEYAFNTQDGALRQYLSQFDVTNVTVIEELHSTRPSPAGAVVTPLRPRRVTQRRIASELRPAVLAQMVEHLFKAKPVALHGAKEEAMEAESGELKTHESDTPRGTSSAAGVTTVQAPPAEQPTALSLKMLILQHCQILLLRYGQELTPKQIAAQLGISERSVRRSLKHATEALVELMPFEN